MTKLRIKASKEIAEAKGLNMSTLSRRADLGFSTVKRLWQHPESSATTDTLERVAQALGVQIQDLFEQESVGGKKTD